LATDQLFSRTTNSGTSSYFTDRLGSAIALANSAGEVKTSYTYDPFGGVTKTGEASDNPFQFTGRENDGTSLQYNRARYYSPSMGRFISQDPAGFAGSGANLYWYANGNPIDFTDSSGESVSPTIGDWSGGQGASSDDGTKRDEEKEEIRTNRKKFREECQTSFGDRAYNQFKFVNNYILIEALGMNGWTAAAIVGAPPAGYFAAVGGTALDWALAGAVVPAYLVGTGLGSLWESGRIGAACREAGLK
jgi:RHS repeat-associated protein